MKLKDIEIKNNFRFVKFITILICCIASLIGPVILTGCEHTDNNLSSAAISVISSEADSSITTTESSEIESISSEQGNSSIPESSADKSDADISLVESLPESHAESSVISEVESAIESTVSADESEVSTEPPKPDIKYSTAISIGKSYTVNIKEGINYPDIAGKEMTDGENAASPSYNDAGFTGWMDGTPEIIIDLGKMYDTIYKFEVSYLCTDEAGIAPPKKINVQYSNDAKMWASGGSLPIPAFTKNTIKKTTLSFDKYISARYVKFTFEKGASWIFLDELSVIADVDIGNYYISSVVLEKKYNSFLPYDIPFEIDQITHTIDFTKVYAFNKNAKLYFTIKHNGTSVKNGSVIVDNKIAFIYSRSNKLTLVCKDGKTIDYAVKLNGENFGLPVVYITTNSLVPISTTAEYTLGNVSILSGDGNDIYYEAIQIRVRGNSTRSHPKLAYRFKFEQKFDVLGMGEAKNWVLLANHSDKSLLRNMVAFYLAEQFPSTIYAPSITPVEVYLNNEYIGVYTLGDHLQVQETRVDIEEGSNDVDTGYFLECDVRATEEDRRYFDLSGMLFSVISPEPVTDAQYNYIYNYVKNIDTLLLNKDEKVWDYLDMNTCVDWLLAKEICGATGMGYDAYMYKGKGGKLCFGPVWDYDLAFGNADFGGAERYDRFYLCSGQWMALWLNYDSFKALFFDRWEDAKQTYIPDTIKKMWEYYDQLKTAAEHNFTKWNILNTYVWPNPPKVMEANTYKKQVEYVEWYINNHVAWMDEQFKSMK